MEWKTGLPEVSGEYVVYTTYGRIITLMYSAKHKLFNSVNSMNTEEALKISLNDDIEKWIELDNFVKNYVLSDEEYLKSLKDKEKELWTKKSNDHSIEEQNKIIKATMYKIIKIIDDLNNDIKIFDYAKPSSTTLSKFEFDLLSVINTAISGTTFEYHPQLMGMKSRGHFKDVDPKMKLEEILRDVVNKQ